MNLRFDYLPYRRKFLQPLSTAHGKWSQREGIVLRLEDADGRVGFGEIAPIPWFGTETFRQALEWCAAVSPSIPQNLSVPKGLPCCGFAVASAFQQINGNSPLRSFTVAALVISRAALQEKQARGFSTFKIKIGVHDFFRESNRVDEWCSQLSPGQCLRLDANGGLAESDYSSWLEFLEGKPVEFLEQPLSPGLENRMLEMAEPFSTPIALDESVTGIKSLSEWASWPGPLVVKPALLGSVELTLPPRALGSSVFETAFGFEAGLRFLASHQKTDTAIGFDTTAFMEDDGWALHPRGPRLTAGTVSVELLQNLWEAKK